MPTNSRKKWASEAGATSQHVKETLDRVQKLASQKAWKAAQSLLGLFVDEMRAKHLYGQEIKSVERDIASACQNDFNARIDDVLSAGKTPHEKQVDLDALLDEVHGLMDMKENADSLMIVALRSVAARVREAMDGADLLEWRASFDKQIAVLQGVGQSAGADRAGILAQLDQLASEVAVHAHGDTRLEDELHDIVARTRDAVIHADVSGKIATLFRTRRRVPVNDVCTAIGLSVQEALPHLFELSDDFDFVIDGKYLELKGADINTAIAQLDK